MLKTDDKPNRDAAPGESAIGALEREVRVCLDRRQPIPATLINTVCLKYRPDIMRFLSYNGLNSNAVDDVTQVTLIRAARGLPGFRGGSSLKTWMNTIAINCLKEYKTGAFVRREITVTSYLGAADGDDDTAANWQDTIHPVAGGASESMARSPEALMIEKDELRRADAALTPEQRVVVRLVGQGYSYQEIGDALGMPEGGVRGRLSRARTFLQRLAKEG